MSEATLAAALKVINTHCTTPPGIDGDQWADETSAAIVDELDLLKEVQTITASATFDPTKQAVLVNTANAITVTLPASLPIGTEARVSRIVASTNAITVATSGSELIEGVASFAFNLGFSVLVFKKVTATLWLRQIGAGIIESGTDLVTFGDGTVVPKQVYPVGSIYLTVAVVSPATLFGGTWAVFGTGRTLVAVNTGDGNFNTVEKTGGASTHTLAIGEIPSHGHNSRALSGYVTQQLHRDPPAVSGIVTSGVEGDNTVASGSYTYRRRTTYIDATHTHDSQGSGSAHNNLQPYITVYMWKRTA